MNIPLLKTICETPGAPGFENRIREVVLKELSGLVDEVSVDNMGNIIAFKKGKHSGKMMVSAHMDEIGFIVTHVDEQGFLRFHTLGGFDPKTLTSQRVIVHGKKDLVGVMGSKPIHLMKDEEKSKAPKISDYYIDLGMPKAEVDSFVEVGNPITRERGLIEMGNCVNCKSIDNRVSVFILLEVLKNLQTPPKDLYAVFSVQEEVGLRGANVATLSIQPDFAFCLDTTIAFDTPGAAAHEKITSLGAGTGIKIMDGRTICDSRMVTYMKEQAIKHSIPWQPEILTAGGTDTAGMQQLTAGGSIAGAISIPTRHIHSVIEMAHKNDIQASIDLLSCCLLEIETFNPSYEQVKA
jgi:tetrahedral aminopeptidase